MEMTELEKKAIDVIRNHSHKLVDNFTQEDLENREISIFLTGYHEGNKANEWHKVADGDLHKETGDYITNIGVLTYDHYGSNIYKWHTPFCEACDYGDEVDDNEVIAWCEIPKYTEK